MRNCINRIISTILIVSLTIGIWYQTDVFAKRAEFAKKVNSDGQNLITYGDYEDINEEFNSKKDTVEGLIESAGLENDYEFIGNVKSLFSDFYKFLIDIATQGGAVTDYASAEEQFTNIFNRLFALDTKLNEMNPEAMGELTNRGFVTAAISIVWELVTMFDTNRVNSQTMEKGIKRLEDIPYINDGKNEHKLDVFYPENTTEKLPVIIDIHGGGLMMGDKDSNRVYCSVLAKKGYTVVAINYRLCPDVLYPSQVQDVIAAFKWVHDNADKYYIDLNKVYVTGDSAGGNLAYYAPVVDTSEELQKLYEVDSSGLSVDAIGLVSGMVEMKSGFNAPLISTFLGFDYKNSPYYNYLQPEEVLPLGKLPPCYIVTCSRDFLHSSGVYFDEVLSKMGIEHQFRDWGLTVNKSSGHITSVAYPEYEESKQTIDEMLAFFESHTE